MYTLPYSTLPYPIRLLSIKNICCSTFQLLPQDANTAAAVLHHWQTGLGRGPACLKIRRLLSSKPPKGFDKFFEKQGPKAPKSAPKAAQPKKGDSAPRQAAGRGLFDFIFS